MKLFLDVLASLAYGYAFFILDCLKRLLRLFKLNKLFRNLNRYRFICIFFYLYVIRYFTISLRIFYYIMLIYQVFSPIILIRLIKRILMKIIIECNF